MRELGKLDAALGRDGSALCRDVLANRMFIEQVAAVRGMKSQRDIDRQLQSPAQSP